MTTMNPDLRGYPALEQWEPTGCRTADLSPTATRVCDLVEALELAVGAGSGSRLWALVHNQEPPALDPETLLWHMDNTYGRGYGYSCWDLCVALAHLLRADGIDAGVTATFGAEPGAPAEPHALVRIDDNGSTLLADPYFGIGVLTPNGTWASESCRASVISQPRRGGAELVTLTHRAYTRRYAYHVLPGHLSTAQLHAMLWQALDYGDCVRHTRGGSAFRLIDRGDAGAELRQWVSGSTDPVVSTGTYEELFDTALAATGPSRRLARRFLFGWQPPVAWEGR